VLAAVHTGTKLQSEEPDLTMEVFFLAYQDFSFKRRIYGQFFRGGVPTMLVEMSIRAEKQDLKFDKKSSGSPTEPRTSLGLFEEWKASA
jgi:hypothetical protein